MKKRNFAFAIACAFALAACEAEPPAQPQPGPDAPVIPDSECPRRDGEPCR